VSQGLGGVRQVARERKQERFTALLHHLTVDLLRESGYALKRNAAPGVNGMRWGGYGDGLEDRLKDLHGRVHRGAYRAQPSRRVYLPKADGRQRPLGIAALEDKIVQQAVVTILNEIYEVDFRGFSDVRNGPATGGFGRGATRRGPRWFRGALDALHVGIQPEICRNDLETAVKCYRVPANRAPVGASPNRPARCSFSAARTPSSARRRSLRSRFKMSISCFNAYAPGPWSPAPLR
jgi:hypothetical protein